MSVEAGVCWWRCSDDQSVFPELGSEHEVVRRQLWELAGFLFLRNFRNLDLVSFIFAILAAKKRFRYYRGIGRRRAVKLRSAWSLPAWAAVRTMSCARDIVLKSVWHRFPLWCVVTYCIFSWRYWSMRDIHPANPGFDPNSYLHYNFLNHCQITSTISSKYVSHNTLTYIIIFFFPKLGNFLQFLGH